MSWRLFEYTLQVSGGRNQRLQMLFYGEDQLFLFFNYISQHPGVNLAESTLIACSIFNLISLRTLVSDSSAWLLV